VVFGHCKKAKSSVRFEGELMRLAKKVAVVVGAGQTPGETIGNGRAVAVLFAREGAKVLLVDRDENSVRETQDIIVSSGGEARYMVADIVEENDCKRIAETAISAFGRIDILHNNVGIGTADEGPTSITAEAWDTIMEVNVKGAFMTCKYVLPIMRKQGSGSIINISSVAALCSVGIVAYKTSKAALNAFTHAVAMGNAKFGVRANVIMPGLMDTPMAIEGIADARKISKDELRKQRDSAVPLRGKMGTAWDIAYASLFLASDEAAFITGIELPVDGGQRARIG
jgi:NAD(P)-dependent dehydrogenase (short-subunit alcohol dehydrogenase family)